MGHLSHGELLVITTGYHKVNINWRRVHMEAMLSPNSLSLDVKSDTQKTHVPTLVTKKKNQHVYVTI